jgi:hypothetical protein
MEIKELGVGSRVRHPQYGDGIVTAVKFISYNIYFPGKGRTEISKDFQGLEIIEQLPPDDDMVSLSTVENVLTGLLRKHADLQEVVPLGERWTGGTLILQPRDKSQKGKEMPVDTFFHKIVMVRDRLRVLEQNINSSKLSDEEKVNLQQYITRIYGSLTSFNVLFRNKEQQFVGEKSGGE